MPNEKHRVLYDLRVSVDDISDYTKYSTNTIYAWLRGEDTKTTERISIMMNERYDIDWSKYPQLKGVK